VGLIFPDRGPSLLPLVPRSFIESALLSRPLLSLFGALCPCRQEVLLSRPLLSILPLLSRSLIESAIVVVSWHTLLLLLRSY